MTTGRTSSLGAAQAPVQLNDTQLPSSAHPVRVYSPLNHSASGRPAGVAHDAAPHGPPEPHSSMHAATPGHRSTGCSAPALGDEPAARSSTISTSAGGDADDDAALLADMEAALSMLQVAAHALSSTQPPPLQSGVLRRSSSAHGLHARSALAGFRAAAAAATAACGAQQPAARAAPLPGQRRQRRTAEAVSGRRASDAGTGRRTSDGGSSHGNELRLFRRRRSREAAAAGAFRGASGGGSGAAPAAQGFAGRFRSTGSSSDEGPAVGPPPHSSELRESFTATPSSIHRWLKRRMHGWKQLWGPQLGNSSTRVHPVTLAPELQQPTSEGQEQCQGHTPAGPMQPGSGRLTQHSSPSEGVGVPGAAGALGDAPRVPTQLPAPVTLHACDAGMLAGPVRDMQGLPAEAQQQQHSSPACSSQPVLPLARRLLPPQQQQQLQPQLQPPPQQHMRWASTAV